MERIILQFKLPMIDNLSIIHQIVTVGYSKTGNKFSVNFNGSKGYLSHIEIIAEGVQKKRNNILWVERMHNSDGSLMDKTIKIFFSSEMGVRIEESE